jgi:hypothetical protein
MGEGHQSGGHQGAVTSVRAQRWGEAHVYAVVLSAEELRARSFGVIQNLCEA